MVSLIVLGLVFAVSGLGLIGAFGILSFLGFPLLAIGLGLISAGVDPDAKDKHRAAAAASMVRRSG
jgi:hypothetical protein